MNAPDTDHPHRRMSDRGWLGRVRSWWYDWGAIATGLAVLALSIVVAVVGVGLLASKSQTARQARGARATSHAACLRTRQLAPPLVKHFESFKGTPYALPPHVLELYRETIPKDCR